MVSEREYRQALENVANNAGVSIKEVETSYRDSLKKSAASVAGLFLSNSVITLSVVKKNSCVGCRCLPTKKIPDDIVRQIENRAISVRDKKLSRMLSVLASVCKYENIEGLKI